MPSSLGKKNIRNVDVRFTAKGQRRSKVIWLDLAGTVDKFYPECDLWEEALIQGK